MARWAARVCIATWFPRALPSLYYTCKGPQRACPAGEQGWMAKTGECENYRPPRACHVGEEDRRSCASWGTSFTVRTSRTGSGRALRFGGSLPTSFTGRASRPGFHTRLVSPVPWALPSLYYTCKGPQRACPAGEQGWMAKRGECENYRPPRACHVSEEDWRSCASWGTSFTVRTSRTGSGLRTSFRW